MEFVTQKVTVENGVAVVRMSRPTVNAVSAEFRDELTRVFEMLSDDDHVRSIVLTGDGSTFCAGADLRERRDLKGKRGAYLEHNRLIRGLFFAIRKCVKPVIAAINGPAVGAGLVFAMCADIRLIAEDAWVAMPEMDVGLAGGVSFICEHFSQGFAREMYYTARRVTAQELYHQRLCGAPVPPDQLMARALEIATSIAAKSPLAIQGAKYAFNMVEHMSIHDGYDFEQGITIELSKSEDSNEAQSAFLEKRQPVFYGR